MFDDFYERTLDFKLFEESVSKVGRYHLLSTLHIRYLISPRVEEQNNYYINCNRESQLLTS